MAAWAGRSRRRSPRIRASSWTNDNGEVLVDFSAPDALRASLDRAVSAGIPLLIGTTGLIDEHDALIADAAKIIPILRAPNTSLGVALLADLTERAARVLGPDNGTSRSSRRITTGRPMRRRAPRCTSATAADRGRGGGSPDERGRDGTGLKREQGAIGYAAIRGGTVAGDHDVMFLGPDERLILSHRAESRAIFARGALAAARFLRGKPAGLYTMRDVIDAA